MSVFQVRPALGAQGWWVHRRQVNVGALRVVSVRVCHHLDFQTIYLPVYRRSTLVTRVKLCSSPGEIPGSGFRVQGLRVQGLGFRA